jgi:glyoxylate/hydroxypyruvate reductase A
MPPVVKLSVDADEVPVWRAALARAFAEAGLAVELRLAGETVAPETVSYLVYVPSGPVRDFRPYTGLKALLSLWAGVEKALANPTLPADTPLCRMVDPGMTRGMVEYLVAETLRHHLDLDARRCGPDGGWPQTAPPLAGERRVGVLGLGELGAEVARTLAGLGFVVRGWSRTPKRIEGVRCLAGAAGLDETLSQSEILACVLPRTPATENLLDARAFGLTPRGATIINAGRGELIDDAALLAALDDGRIARATLDVFRVEPLPADHPFRRHPRVFATAHVAAFTRPRSAAAVIAAQIARAEVGLELLHVVDRARGY